MNHNHTPHEAGAHVLASLASGGEMNASRREMTEYRKALIDAVAGAIGRTFGKPELDWTEEAIAALAAYREFATRGQE